MKIFAVSVASLTNLASHHSYKRIHKKGNHHLMQKA